MNKEWLKMKLIVEGKELEYSKAVKIDEIVWELYGFDHDILLAKVNGKPKELWRYCHDGDVIEFLSIKDADGRKAYERALIFLFVKSVHDLYSIEEVSKVQCDHLIGNGLFLNICGTVKADDNFIEKVKARMDEIIMFDIMYEKRAMPTEEAIQKFLENNLTDKENLFKYRRVSTTNVYRLGNYTDYFYGFMPPTTGMIKSFDLLAYEGGAVLVLPERGKGFEEERPSWQPKELLFKTMKEADSWAKGLGISNVGELNNMISKGKIGDIMLVNEALQERKLSKIAEEIASNPEKKIIMIAGPSSSGKTTSSHRLSVQLMVNGLVPHTIAADDYFKNREDTPKDENGDYDFESLLAIDTEQFNKDMADLLNGKEVSLPTYNFKTGKREYKGNTLKLGKDDILVIEGIHCLNDEFSKTLPKSSKVKIYISALTQLNIDDHNRVHTSDLRLLRRMIRDARTRGNTAEDTLARWASVRRGEERNIFPYQEEADFMLDSSLIYEIPIIKQYAEPLLFGIEPSSPHYAEANRLLKFLSYFLGVPSDDVPKNSLVREFIGGSCFNS